MERRIGIFTAAAFCYFASTVFINGCAPQEKRITIMGTISFDGYSQGDIYVAVFDDKPALGGNVLERTKIAQPGYYELKLTLSGQKSGIKRIYVTSFNDAAGNGPPPDSDDPLGGYAGNPIQLGPASYELFSNIDVFLGKKE